MTLFVAIAVVGLFRPFAALFLLRLAVGIAASHHSLVSNSEERSLQDVDMSLLHQVGEEHQEERDDQQADVHAVDIGIGGDDYLVIAKSFDAIFDVERRLQEVELIILIHHLLGHAVGVQRLASQ